MSPLPNFPGYGRNETEATMNCIKNFLEFIIEEEGNIPTVMKALKKGNYPLPISHSTEGSETTATVQPTSTTPQATKSPQKVVSTIYGGSKYPPRDLEKANNTLTLNASYAQGLENNNSFDGKGDIEILSKNIGNISMINNSKIYEGNANNVSQLEMDDLILKLMFEDNKKAPLPPNPHASQALKDHLQNHNLHQYQASTQQTYPTSSQQAAINHYQASTQATPQYQQVTVPSLNFEHRSNSVSTSQKIAQGSFDNTNVQRSNSNSRPSVNGAFENEFKKTPTVEQSSTAFGQGFEYNTTHTDTKNEFKYEPKFDVSKYEKFETKESNTPNSAKMKNSYSNSNIGANNKSQTNLSDYNTKETTSYHSNNNTKCSCNCSDQLQKANIKIENLEKKIKLLLEENKVSPRPPK